MSSLYQNVEMAPRDPILGLNEQFNSDTRTEKVNLGIGVYSDDEGRLPYLKLYAQLSNYKLKALIHAVIYQLMV